NASWLQRPVWAGSQSLGIGLVLCGWDERAENPRTVAHGWHAQKSRTAFRFPDQRPRAVPEREYSSGTSWIEKQLLATPGQHRDARERQERAVSYPVQSLLYGLLHLSSQRPPQPSSGPPGRSRSSLPVQ